MKLLLVTILAENRQQLIDALETMIGEIEEAADLTKYSKVLDGDFPQLLADSFNVPVEIRDIYDAQDWIED
jgi:hypothetical protein